MKRVVIAGGGVVPVEQERGLPRAPIIRWKARDSQQVHQDDRQDAEYAAGIEAADAGSSVTVLLVEQAIANQESRDAEKDVHSARAVLEHVFGEKIGRMYEYDREVVY